jgi:hypothetical protein
VADKRTDIGNDLIESNLNEHVIDSLETFEWVTASPREIAALYFYQQLDELIELARAISLDFFDRPKLYTDLGDATLVTALARLHARYGSDEQYLSCEQRKKIYAPIFEDEGHQFLGARDILLTAAAAYAERVYDTGQEMLYARVRNAHWSFRAHLLKFNGASLSWSRREALPTLTDQTAYRMLRASGITAVFSLMRTAIEEWPYQVDGDGDKMVEEVSKALDVPLAKPWLAEQFNSRQLVALRGAEAIATVLDYNGERDNRFLDRLITKCYTWYAALVHESDMMAVPALNGNRPLASLTTRPGAQPVFEPDGHPTYMR